MSLYHETLTLTEYTGEDASGNATERVTTHPGAFVEVSEAQRLYSDGAIPAGAAFVAIDPSGFGVGWGVKPGDLVTARSRSGKVISATPVYNPRTGVLHHVEATTG